MIRRTNALLARGIEGSWSWVIAVLLGAVILFIAYIPPLDDSFWIDETLTAWVIDDGLVTALERGFRFQFGTPLYIAIAWVVRSVFPASEVALRLPSLGAVVIAAVALWRLGTRLFDSSTGLIAAVLFLALPAVRFAGTDARPYALAVTMLVLSTLFLCRWIDEGKTRDRVLYAVFTAAVFYVHYVLAIALLAQIPFFFLRRTEVARRIRRSEVITVVALLVALLVPAIPHVLYLLGRRGAIQVPPQPFFTIVRDLMPMALLFSIIGAMVVGGLVSRDRPRVVMPQAASGLVLVMGWALLPFLVLFGLAAATDLVLSVARYFTSSGPAVALALAAAISLQSSLAARWISAGAGVLVFIVILAPPSVRHTDENWKAVGAAQRALADPSTPTLLFSGLIESKTTEWPPSPTTADYLNSPADTYGMEGLMIPAPWEMTPETDSYLHDVARKHLTAGDEFLLVTRGRDVTKAWIDENLLHDGFSLESFYNWNGTIFLFRYTRDGDL